VLKLKVTEKIRLLSWVKRKYRLNVPFVKRNLSEEDFDALLEILRSLKEIGGIYDAAVVVEDFLNERGAEFKPRTSDGDHVNYDLFYNTHQSVEGEVRVFLRHLLLGQGKDACRKNIRHLSSDLKERGFSLEYAVPIETVNWRREPVVVLNGIGMRMPREGLRSSGCFSESFTDISTWIAENTPPFYVGGDKISLDISRRWTCHFTKRFIDLFELSELSYLHKGRERGFYQRGPQTELISRLAFRDVFASYTLDEWVNYGIDHESTSYTKTQREAVFSVLKEYVLYNIGNIKIYSKSVSLDAENVYGWKALLVLHLIREAIMKGK
jgi:hypothetical protein